MKVFTVGMVNNKYAIFCNNQPFLKCAGKFSITKTQANTICKNLTADDNFHYLTRDLNPQEIDIFIDNVLG